MNDAEAHEIASELKELVGWGATPHKLVTMPRIRALTTEASLAEDASARAIGVEIQALLRGAIQQIGGGHQILGFPHIFSARQVQSALEVLLALNRTGKSATAPNRRSRAIAILRLHVAVDQWRRPDGPEFELMMILAKTLLEKKARPVDQGYYNRRFEERVWLNEHGVPWFEIIETIVVTAETLTRVRHQWVYSPDRRPGVVEMQPLSGCSVVEDTWKPALKQQETWIRFPALTKGDEYSYAYRGIIHSDQPLNAAVYQKPLVPMEAFSLEISVDPKRQPRQVWLFEDIDAWDIPGEPSHPQRPRNGLTYAHVFHGLKASRCYGLAWAWM